MDTCYKIHGYPVSFKPKIKPQSEKQAFPAKSQPSSQPMVAQMVLATPTSTDVLPQMVNTLSNDQIQGVIAYFNSQLQSFDEPSSCSGTITALLGMAFSSSTLHFLGVYEPQGLLYLLSLG